MEEKKASLWSVVNILNEAGARQQHFVALGTERGLNKNYHYSEPRSRHTTVCYSAQQRFTLAAVRAGRCWMDREIFFKGRTDVKASPRTRGKKKKKKKNPASCFHSRPWVRKMSSCQMEVKLISTSRTSGRCLSVSVRHLMDVFICGRSAWRTHPQNLDPFPASVFSGHGVILFYFFNDLIV